ncbi:peptidase M50B family protein [Nitzschia inconspicua]|uniref:Peptidase M50B family protein n=1 Tax=Nitzschia inconspicua TaxID=303405 RepID=A0A9K3M0Y8_9STRA|nr:peptidase M50B family protein [Nitzschia inconspicua]
MVNTASLDDPPGCCEQALDYNRLPDACTNEIREENLIARQQKKKDEFDNRNWLHRFVERERNLLIACIVLVVCMNISTGRYILYPFMIFSTWVHEMCHAMAALLMGGYVQKLQIFRDGSGLAYTAVSGSWKRGFVASGGYPGTATLGCILLLFRRTTLGPTVGTISIGLLMVLSCAMWVRNGFGLAMLLSEGIVLSLLGWKLPAHFLDVLFSFLAATCSLNAVESIHDLFAVGNYYVGGEEVTNSDAHTVAEKWGMDYRFWAILWLVFSFVMTAVGIIFAFNARENQLLRRRNTHYDNAVRNEIIDAEVMPVTYISPPATQNYITTASRPAPSPPLYDQSMSTEQPQASASPQEKKKRKWFGFLKKKPQYQATLY